MIGFIYLVNRQGGLGITYLEMVQEMQRKSLSILVVKPCHAASVSDIWSPRYDEDILSEIHPPPPYPTLQHSINLYSVTTEIQWLTNYSLSGILPGQFFTASEIT